MRILKWVAGITAILLALLVLPFALPNWNWLREPLARRVSEQTGRTLTIGGDLHVRPGWPLTHISSSEIRFSNPSWAREKNMISLRQVALDVDMLPLFSRSIELDRVVVDQAGLFFEKAVDGRKNWLLDRNQRDDQARIKVRSLLITNGQIGYLDPAEHTDITAHVATPGKTNDQANPSLVFKAQGTYKGQALNAAGRGDNVMALRDATSPYPLSVAGRIGPSTVSADGAVTSLLQLSAVDLHITLHGGSLAQLYTVLGIVLPETPPYTTRGRLLHRAGVWRYENFSGKIGKSDIAGTLQVDTRPPRSYLTAALTSRRLNLADLGPLVGTRAPDGTTDAPAAPSGRVLPSIAFRAERWNQMDADVTLNAESIERPAAVPLNRLSTRLQLRDAVLTLDPLQFGVAGGSLAGKIELDGRAQPMRATAILQLRKLKIAALFPTFDLNQTSIGLVNGDIDLHGRGDTVATMLGSADGTLALALDGGEISKLMMESASLHLLEILQLKMSGDKPVKINCGVAGFEVKQGVMRSDIVLLDTDVSRILASGTVNLDNEKLDLLLVPKSKKFSLVALRTPIHVRGSFAHPDVGLDKGKLALRGLGAVALGAVNPLLALLAVVETGPGADSDCAKLIREAKASSASARLAAQQSSGKQAP